MTISQWPTVQRIIQAESSPAVLSLGAFKLDEAMQLQKVLLYLVKVGSLGGSETSTIGIYGNSDLTAAIATSSAFTVADAPNVSSSAWRGWIAHTFAADVPLANDTWYHLGLSLANYTRNGDTFYIAAQLDDERHYMPAYGSRVTAAKFRLIGER